MMNPHMLSALRSEMPVGAARRAPSYHLATRWLLTPENKIGVHQRRQNRVIVHICIHKEGKHCNDLKYFMSQHHQALRGTSEQQSVVANSTQRAYQLDLVTYLQRLCESYPAERKYRLPSQEK